MNLLPPSPDVLGFAAATLTTAAFVPQVWLTWRTRNASGVSLGMYAIFSIGVALWLIYGLLIHSLPIVIANSITLLLSAAVLMMKLVFKTALPAPSDR
jgi:MtN3 and saliva related transmembrane protein